MQRATHLTALLGVLRLFGTERGLALSLQLGCSGCRDRGCGGGACSWPTLCRRKNVKVIQEMLGHASAAMTLDVYAEPAPRRCYFYLPGDGGSRRPFMERFGPRADSFPLALLPRPGARFPSWN
jgi:hypothetical protein